MDIERNTTRRTLFFACTQILSWYFGGIDDAARGRTFDLDDALAKFLPEFADLHVLKPDASGVADTLPAQNMISIRHILSHSAGLSYGFIEPTSIVDQAT